MKKLMYLLLVVGLFSCEKEVVKIIYGPPSGGLGDQKVLVEEFTGIKCVNCPAGTKQLESFSELNPDKLITVSIHAGFFAAPITKSKYDFRTISGNELLNYLVPGSFPTVAFNRVLDKKMYAFESLDWADKIQSLVSKNAKSSLVIETAFNESTRELKVLLSGIAKEDFKEDILANVLITESNIVDIQLDITKGEIEDYVHNNVLRTAIEPIPGTKIASSLPLGEAFSKEFTYIVPEEWKAENCKVIGYISYSSKKEIIQVEETKLK